MTDNGFKQRVGNCYELSAKAVAKDPTDSLLLAHGSVEGMGFPRNPHAWCVHIDTGMIFDPVLDSWIDPVVHRLFFKAITYATYTPLETRIELLAQDNYGPWDIESEAEYQRRISA